MMNRAIRYATFFFVLILAFGMAAAQQSEPARPTSPPPSQSAPEKPEVTAEPQNSEPQKPAAEAHAGKHESSAEEGEGEEENATLKYSPMVAKLGKLLGLGPKAAYRLFTGLNFAVVVIAFLGLLKSKILVGMRERKLSIRSAIEAAQKASAEADARLAAIEGRLAKLDTEVAGLKSEAEADFKSEERRIQQQAEEDAQRVVQAAEQEIATAVKDARRDLKIFAADLAVSLAEKKISVDRDTDEQLVQSFVDQLGKDGK
jgi:F-type H+-transporting ATPase subunit b